MRYEGAIFQAKARPFILSMTEGNPAPPRPSPEIIIAAVADAHGLSSRELISPRRRKACIIARFHAIEAVWKTWPEISSVKLAAMLGNRHHTTVLNAVKSWARLKQNYTWETTQIEMLLKGLS